MYLYKFVQNKYIRNARTQTRISIYDENVTEITLEKSNNNNKNKKWTYTHNVLNPLRIMMMG